MGKYLDGQRTKPPVTPLAASKAELFDQLEEKDRDWLNPISMSVLQKAIKRKAALVILNGVEYSITYGEEFTSRATGETRECVKLKRTDGGFAPFGYISVKRIRDFTFEEK